MDNFADVLFPSPSKNSQKIESNGWPLSVMCFPGYPLGLMPSSAGMTVPALLL